MGAEKWKKREEIMKLAVHMRRFKAQELDLLSFGTLGGTKWAIENKDFSVESSVVRDIMLRDLQQFRRFHTRPFAASTWESTK